VYILYTAELDYVVARHQIFLHQYADDGQIYVSSPVDQVSPMVDRFAACLQNDVDNEQTTAQRVKDKSCVA